MPEKSWRPSMNRDWKTEDTGGIQWTDGSALTLVTRQAESLNHKVDNDD
jgi:hypothetical protein